MYMFDARMIAMNTAKLVEKLINSRTNSELHELNFKLLGSLGQPRLAVRDIEESWPHLMGIAQRRITAQAN